MLIYQKGEFNFLFILFQLHDTFILFFVSVSLLRPFTKEQAEALKQPNSNKTFHKQFFSVFHQKGILYSFAYDFNDTGGFQAWWNEIYGLAQKFRSDLGNKPNQAAVDPDAEAKIRQLGKYDPFNNYNDCLKLLIRFTLKNGALRGSSEVRMSFFYFCSFILFFLLTFFQPHMLRRTDFQCGIEEHGEYQGRKFIDILPNAKNTKTM